ncbi:hypothetical protein O1611_g10065 [Lasiodiplodia mahajangana]|uniref:Uncharacterized protein n=1 Tax=Lasiodiplodia mahajangana TaxID=1108764 RepID=A0ACC2J2B0_9PEZI|nr:hypothetical protein O1611_g10065 [Lasiodiplodia mahajangana]
MRRTTIARTLDISRLLQPSFTISALPRRFISTNQNQNPAEYRDITAPRASCKAPDDNNNNNNNNDNNNKNADSSNHNNIDGSTNNDDNKNRKTVAQLDEELRQKMSGIAGDGGESGIEYEDGKPVAMKRGVRNNMFRYI